MNKDDLLKLQLRMMDRDAEREEERSAVGTRVLNLAVAAVIIFGGVGWTISMLPIRSFVLIPLLAAGAIVAFWFFEKVCGVEQRLSRIESLLERAERRRTEEEAATPKPPLQP